MNVASVQLCLRSWYGHPDAGKIERLYREARLKEGDGPSLNWTSGLRCWNLLNDEGLLVGRAYEPTDQTPFWVWTDDRGDRGIAQPLTMERLTVLMVEYRLMGGTYA